MVDFNHQILPSLIFGTTICFCFLFFLMKCFSIANVSPLVSDLIQLDCVTLKHNTSADRYRLLSHALRVNFGKHTVSVSDVG